MEPEAGEEVAGGGGQGGGVGSRLGEAAGAGGLGAVGVGDGEREGLGDLAGRAQPSAELLDQAEDRAVVPVRIELVAVEPVSGAHGLGRGTWDDGALVDAVGEVVVGGILVGALVLHRDPDMRHWGADGLDPGLLVSLDPAMAGSSQVAERFAECVRVWDREVRESGYPPMTIHPAGTPADQLPPGDVLDKPSARLVFQRPGRTPASALSPSAAWGQRA